MLIAVPVLCAAIGFALGHYASAREPFYFIGTPVDIGSSRVAPATDNTDHSSQRSEALNQGEQLVIFPSSADGICGARTKSGKPCKRKVKGGEYCWQHRDQKGPGGK